MIVVVTPWCDDIDPYSYFRCEHCHISTPLILASQLGMPRTMTVTGLLSRTIFETTRFKPGLWCVACMDFPLNPLVVIPAGSAVSSACSKFVRKL